MKNRKLITVLACILVVIIGAAAASIIIFNSDDADDKYRKKIETANKYIDDENWEDAIVAYLEAIEIDDKDENAYLALAQIYVYQNQMDEAKAILEQGIKATGSKKLQDYYDRFFSDTSNSSDDEQGDKEEVVPEINTSLLKQIGKYSFGDYAEKYGFSDISMSGDICNVTYGNLKGATFAYYNTDDNQRIVDVTNETPRNESMPWEVTFDTLSSIVSGVTDKLSYEALNELGVKRLNYNSNSRTVSFESNNCEVTIECDADGNITLDSQVTVVPKEGNKEVEEKSEVKGLLVSATTGQGVGHATIYVRDRGDYVGTPILEIETEANGTYEMELEKGEYTAEIECEGFINENIDFEIDRWGDISIEQFVISEKLEEGQIRIVLEWGEYPVDLDSHLIGSTSAGNNIHVFFGNKAEDAANLDVDDTTSYGPETITILDINGTYEYYVHDYRMTNNISTSNAIVKVYVPGNATPYVYQVPAGLTNDWYVCRIQNGVVSDY